jgi:hypothetical protein
MRQEKGGPRAPPSSRMVGPISHLMVPFPNFFVSMDRLALKPAIYMNPRAISRWDDGKQRIHNMDLNTTGIGAETLQGRSWLPLCLH